MKHLARTILAVFLAVLMGTLLPVQVFASTPDYISEVKIGMGKTADEAKAALKGYTILDTDLNQNAGGGFGSKGEKAVYLGYKTTKDKSEAVTDLALMNMKGGYSVKDYEFLMGAQMKSQIIPLVESLLAPINEYRANYVSKNKKNKQRARYIYDILNKFIDDDTGKGLGDLLLNETKYEMGDEAYNALSDEEKKEHADIVTIIAQSNGKAMLMLQNLVTRAADTGSDSWLERFSTLDYDTLVDNTGLSPTDAAKKLAKFYDDKAYQILDSWEDLRQELLKYDTHKKTVKTYDSSKLEEYKAKIEELKALGKDASDKEVEAALDGYMEALAAQAKLLNAMKIIFIHDSLAEMEYEDGTMLDFFLQSSEELEDDITLLYPIAAALSDGQRTGLEFITLEEMMMIALSEEGGYSDDELDELEPISIYDGVDRTIYEKDAVALTSDTIRADFAEQVEEDNGALSSWTIAMWAITGVMAAAAITNAGLMIGFKAYANWCKNTFNSLNGKEAESFLITHKKVIVLKDYGDTKLIKNYYYEDLFKVRAGYCKWLTVGFTAAMVVLAVISVVLTYQDMKAYYNVEFTPIPQYMVEEKDLIGYNNRGEKVILKNQTAYYKAVECNRTSADEMYKMLGTHADMNGDVGKQWLALYAVKNEAMQPILASSLVAKVYGEKEEAKLPEGYTTGVHMFGSDSAFNLNNSYYDWNNSAPKVYIYFQTDDSAASAAGSNFTAGSLAISGGAGLILGAVVTAVAFTAKRKKETAAATA